MSTVQILTVDKMKIDKHKEELFIEKLIQYSVFI